MKYVLSTNEIRRKWLDFFKSKNHLEVESKSLIPVDDDSLLWINSGVATLKKFFSGQENPPSNRLVNSQKCIRTNDIENIGLTSRHHTFFEMLGNFSIGDYFRKEAIEFASEFLLKELKLSPELLYITVYENDEESFNLWIKNGMIKSHIIKCSKDRNFWEIGQGPCGPCTEVYFDRGSKFDPENQGEKLFFEDIENDRYIEIWNIVFSEFENDGNGNYTKLVRQNIDTGAGLERLACIMQCVNTNYDTDGFVEPRKVLELFSKYKYDENLYFEKNKSELKCFINKSFVVIVDHIKACLFAISDGVIPSNKDRGYILRKLLRRSFFNMDFLGIKKEALEHLIVKLIDVNKEYYNYLVENKEMVCETIQKEYNSYKIAIKNSNSFLEEFVAKNELNEKTLFKLVDTYGFPVEIINELEHSTDLSLIKKMISSISENKLNINFDNFKIDFKKFNSLFNEHRSISKSNKTHDGMEKQNQTLMNLECESIFDYFQSKILNAKILKIFDENFHEVNYVENQNCYVVLDKTCLYATSGGQEHDKGNINEFKIDNVIKNANSIHVHHVLQATLSVGQTVCVGHDVLRRQKTRIHHSSEHLLHSALKNEISNSIKQEGALKTESKFTFDFYYPKKLTFDEIQKIENNIKAVIDKNIDSETLLCDLEEAKKLGALAYFSDVYKKIKGKLRVVRLSDNSIEVCGGTHVKNTSEIFDFKIINITSKGSGSWRIEAISGKENIELFKNGIYKDSLETFEKYKKTIKEFNYEDPTINEIISINPNSIHFLQLKMFLDELKVAVAIINSKNEKNILLDQANKVKEKILSCNNEIIFLENIDRKVLTTCLMGLINEVEDKLILVFNFIDNSFQYILCGNEKFINQKTINLNVLAKSLNEKLNGKGGGRNNFVQGSLKNIDKNEIEQIVSNFINGI